MLTKLSLTGYRPVDHKPLKVADIVLIKEPLLKPANFPMGIVKEVQVNSFGEVMGTTILKGETREVMERHVSNLTPLLCDKEYVASIPEVTKNRSLPSTKVTRPKRQAAEDSQLKTAQLIANDLVIIHFIFFNFLSKIEFPLGSV